MLLQYFENPRVIDLEYGLLISGSYILNADGVRLDTFNIAVIIHENFPIIPPIVLLNDRKIPWTASRHVSERGVCCICVHEDWLIYSKKRDIVDYFDQAIYNFFLSQYYFELSGNWCFGEYEHSGDGLIAAYSNILACEPDFIVVADFLILAASEVIHLNEKCPCGSLKRLTDCHGPQLDVIRKCVSYRGRKRLLSAFFAESSNRLFFAMNVIFEDTRLKQRFGSLPVITPKDLSLN